MLMLLAIIFEEKSIFLSLSFDLLMFLLIVETFKDETFNYYMVNILISIGVLLLAVFIDIIIKYIKKVNV